MSHAIQSSFTFLKYHELQISFYLLHKICTDWPIISVLYHPCAATLYDLSLSPLISIIWVPTLSMTNFLTVSTFQDRNQFSIPIFFWDCKFSRPYNMILRERENSVSNEISTFPLHKPSNSKPGKYFLIYFLNSLPFSDSRPSGNPVLFDFRQIQMYFQWKH